VHPLRSLLVALTVSRVIPIAVNNPTPLSSTALPSTAIASALPATTFTSAHPCDATVSATAPVAQPVAPNPIAATGPAAGHAAA
jgi:hypothetical protein